MIIEDYCSFETAMLLKEKGFDAEIKTYWWKGPHGEPIFEFIPNVQNHDISNSAGYMCFNGNNIVLENEPCCIAPTLQIAMKWLREQHNIFICIIPSEVGAGVMDYTYVLYKIDAKDFYFKDLGIQGRAKNISEISYEQSCEAAIKYCLENLI